MADYSLKVEKRTRLGKSETRRLRRQSIVPGIYYNKKGDNIPVEAAYNQLESVYNKAHKSNIIDLHIKDGKRESKIPVLIWDVHNHPFKDLILHVDFLGVDLKQEMDFDIPIEVSGKAKGEDEGGIVSLFRDAVSVSCLPTAIPDKILVDVTDLDINENLNISQLELPEGVKLKEYEEDFAIVGVMAPTSEEEEEPGEEAEEGEPTEEGPEEGISEDSEE